MYRLGTGVAVKRRNLYITREASSTKSITLDAIIYGHSSKMLTPFLLTSLRSCVIVSRCSTVECQNVRCDVIQAGYVSVCVQLYYVGFRSFTTCFGLHGHLQVCMIFLFSYA
jgi:hypothetical protein